MLLIVAGVARPAATQPKRIPHAEDALTLIAERIVEAQARGGPYAPELIDPLKTLSVLYQERGDYAREAAVLEQAMQVIRANFGLRSLEQAPLIRQRIRGAEANGNFAEAWDLEKAFVSLAEKHPDDLRTVPILHEIGDKRMALLERYLAGERPPQLILGCYYEPPLGVPNDHRNCLGGSRGYAARRMVLEAQGHYANAIAVLRGLDQHANDELHVLEGKLYRNSYLYGGYQVGRRSLVRLIGDDAANGEPVMRRVARLLELADWDLVFAQKSLALDLYAETYEFLQQENFSQATIDDIFAPELPIVLPKFLANRAAPEHADGATGYVDVAFEITRFGTTRRIRVESTSGNVSNAAQGRVTRWIVENHFRPQRVNGQFADAARVVVRHYVHE